LRENAAYGQPIARPAARCVGLDAVQLLSSVGNQPAKRKPKEKSLSELDKDINHWLSSIRIRIDHAIGGVKRYRILKTPHNSLCKLFRAKSCQ